jgi:hypothetical protein
MHLVAAVPAFFEPTEVLFFDAQHFGQLALAAHFPCCLVNRFCDVHRCSFIRELEYVLHFALLSR